MKEKLLKRFGAPVINVELTDVHFEEAERIANLQLELVYSMSEKLFTIKFNKTFWIEQYALAICKEILGRIKIKSINTLTHDNTILDAEMLLNESRIEKEFLNNLILKK